MQKKINNFVILTVGLPRSSKSTFRKNFIKYMAVLNFKGKIVVVCPDDIREEITGDRNNQSRDKDVWPLVHERADEAFNEGDFVFVDATNYNRRNRRVWVSDYPCIVMVFETPLEVCINRAKINGPKGIIPVIEKFAKNFEYPTVGEGVNGFDRKNNIDPVNGIKFVMKNFDRIIVPAGAIPFVYDISDWPEQYLNFADIYLHNNDRLNQGKF